jgi:hypothetical protein
MKLNFDGTPHATFNAGLPAIAHNGTKNFFEIIEEIDGSHRIIVGGDPFTIGGITDSIHRFDQVGGHNPFPDRTTGFVNNGGGSVRILGLDISPDGFGDILVANHGGADGNDPKNFYNGNGYRSHMIMDRDGGWATYYDSNEQAVSSSYAAAFAHQEDLTNPLYPTTLIGGNSWAFTSAAVPVNSVMRLHVNDRQGRLTSPFNTGSANVNGASSVIHDIIQENNGTSHFYAGGKFTSAKGNTISGIAKFDPAVGLCGRSCPWKWSFWQ